MSQRDDGHPSRCPHCGEPLQVLIAHQVARPGSGSRDYQAIQPDGTTEEVELFTKRELVRMADDTEAARDQYEMHQRWQEY